MFQECSRDWPGVTTSQKNTRIVFHNIRLSSGTQSVDWELDIVCCIWTSIKCCDVCSHLTNTTQVLPRDCKSVRSYVCCC